MNLGWICLELLSSSFPIRCSGPDTHLLPSAGVSWSNWVDGATADWVAVALCLSV